jgi:hypothetical protein
VLIGLLALPFIVRQNAWFEWTNPLWQLELQTAHVRAHGTPTSFMDVAGLLFYPQPIFYAGPLLGVLAYPSIVFGAWPVFAAVTAAAFCAMSAGVSWCARNLGAPPALAVLPGLLFAATPYTVSSLYGQATWAELVAVGALAVALGAGTALMLGRARSEAGTMVVLAVAVAVVAGTHNITLLFGGAFGVAVAVALLPTARAAHSDGRVVAAGYLRALGAAVVGVALCGFDLAPDIWLSGRTYISTTASELITQLHSFDRPSIIFDPLPGQPAGVGITDDHTQTLVTAAVWCLIAFAIVRWRRSEREWVATVTVLGAVGVLIGVLIVEPGWWAHFPTILQAIQFPFRLVSYLALTTVLLVALLLARPEIARSRVLCGLLALAAALQLSLAGYLAVSADALPAQHRPITVSSIRTDRIPAAYAPFQRASYRVSGNTILGTPSAVADTSPIGVDTPTRVTLSGAQPPGTLVLTKVVDSPLIAVAGGARPVGVTPYGFLVLQTVSRPWRATVQAPCDTCLIPHARTPKALIVGHWASLLGVLALLGLCGSALVGWRRTALSGRPARH